MKQIEWLRSKNKDSYRGHYSEECALKHFADITASSQLFIIGLIRFHESKILKQIFNFHRTFLMVL